MWLINKHVKRYLDGFFQDLKKEAKITSFGFFKKIYSGKRYKDGVYPHGITELLELQDTYDRASFINGYFNDAIEVKTYLDKLNNILVKKLQENGNHIINYVRLKNYFCQLLTDIISHFGERNDEDRICGRSAPEPSEIEYLLELSSKWLTQHQYPIIYYFSEPDDAITSEIKLSMLRLSIRDPWIKNNINEMIQLLKDKGLFNQKTRHTLIEDILLTSSLEKNANRRECFQKNLLEVLRNNWQQELEAFFEERNHDFMLFDARYTPYKDMSYTVDDRLTLLEEALKKTLDPNNISPLSYAAAMFR